MLSSPVCSSRGCGCGRLGPIPTTWGPAEMDALFRILDPVRDILREMLDREHVERGPAEMRLLKRLKERLREPDVHCPPPPSPRQRQRRPEWVAALAELPGWKSWSDERALA